MHFIADLDCILVITLKSLRRTTQHVSTSKYINIFITKTRLFKYEGVSINNQLILFPIDRDGQDFHALFQYFLYMGTKWHMYRIIL